MPWILSVTLIVLAPLLLVYWLVGKHLASAIVLTTGWDRRRVIRWMAIGFGYLNSFPLIFVVVVLLGGRGSTPAFSGESLLLDVLFVYPLVWTHRPGSGISLPAADSADPPPAFSVVPQSKRGMAEG